MKRRAREATLEVDVPAGYRPPAADDVRDALRCAADGRRLGSGDRFTLEVPITARLDARVGHVTPGFSTFDRRTQIKLRTRTKAVVQAGQGPGEGAAQMFRVRTTPDDRLRRDWEMIAGYDAIANQLLKRFVTMWDHRDKLGPVAMELGLSGKYLFDGPPGTGKSTLARGMVHALSERRGEPVALFEVDGSRIFSKYVGESARNVATLFQQARDAAAKYGFAVLMLDEYDQLAGDRSDDQDHPDARRAVNTFLTEMDRLDVFRDRIALIAISNRSVQTDPAALRRFEQIHRFPLPSAAMRLMILDAKLNAVHKTSGMRMKFSKADLAKAAAATAGYSGSDLARVVGHAVLAAIDRGRLDAGALEAAIGAVKPARMTLGGDGTSMTGNGAGGSTSGPIPVELKS